MTSRLAPWQSLRTRATAFTMLVFVLGIWAMSAYVSSGLQASMERLLGEQQFSVATAMAQQVDREMTTRMQALRIIAKEMDADLLRSPPAVQARLEQRTLLQLLFNGGVWVAGLDGTAMADVPRSANRVGVNFMDRDYMLAALKEGKEAIGQPAMGKQLKAPAFAMAVPVRDAQGKVIGALVGVTDLEQRNFLDNLRLNLYGKTGGYLLIHPQSRQIITATDPKRIMEVLPAPEINRYVDRNIAGYVGYGVLVNALGEEQLASVKQLPAWGWYIVLGLPTAEAFAPMHELKQNLLRATLLLTLIIGTLIWWMLRRQLAPLVATSEAMVALADAKQIPAPLPERQPGEIGHLVAAFNQIVQTWTQREAALTDSQQNLAITFNSIGDAVIATDATGLITRMNPVAERLTGWPLADALGRPLTEVFRIISAETRLPSVDPVQLVMERGMVVGLANHTALLARDGHEYQIADSAAPIRDATDVIVGVVLVFSDVTEKYRAETALREIEAFSHSILDSVSAEIAVLNHEGVIVAVNAPWQQFATENGFRPGHPAPGTGVGSNYLAVCRTGDDLGADNTALDAWQGIQAVLAGHLPNFTLEYPCHSPDEQRWFSLSATPLGATGSGVVVSHTNITARKLSEEALRAAKDHLETTLNAIPDLLFEVDASGRVLSYHAHRSDLLAAPPEVFMGKCFAEVLPPAATDLCMNALREAATKGWVTGVTYSLPLPQGETWFELSAAAMPIVAGVTPRFILLTRDISERHQFELARQESEMRLRLVIRGGDIGFWDWDLRGSGLIVNERWCEMLGLDPKALALDIEVWNSRVHPDDAPKLVRLFEQVIQNPNGQGGEVEVRVRHQAGHYVWILDRFNVVSRAADGTPLRAVGTHLDITERKIAEFALQAALQEKTALLLEVHHRVKNNLQVITSLLRLESFRSTVAPTKSVLQDMQGRVRSMALLHETIYRKGTFAAIDLGSYAGQIAGESLKSMQVNPGAVRLQLDMETLQVGLDQATPAGMLVSELISNSLKHAFPEGRTGEICISLHPLDSSGQWRLRVSDSGIGLPADFEERRKTSLGLQLAVDMATQMGGTLHIGAGPQAVFTVDFKAEVPAPLKINLDGVKP